MGPLLQVENLSLEYGLAREGAVPILKHLDLQVERGEVVGVHGPSGCGKSSLLRCIPGINPPAARVRGGRLLFDDRDLLSLSARERRIHRFRSMGFIGQHPASTLSPYRRVRDQLRDAFTERPSETQLLATLHASAFTDPQRIVGAWPHQLSGGEAQRVVIAQALARQASLLLADEPTSALDTITQREVITLLLSLRVQRRMAMIIVSHDRAVLRAVADRILELRDGALADNPIRSQQRRITMIQPSVPPAILLELRHLHFTYKRNPIRLRASQKRSGLKDICLALTSGEFLAVVGASGSGKSTLARCIAGFGLKYQGDLAFGGRVIRFARDLRTQAAIQLILQDTHGAMNPGLTVAEILVEPLFIQTRRSEQGCLTRESISAETARVLNLVSLPSACLGRHPGELSGGERQRVAIARALMLRPALLLLDEALSGLDRDLQATLLVMLDSLREKMGLTCVHFTHDLGLCIDSANRVAVMHEGRLVECHPAEDFPRLASHPASLRLLNAMLPE